MAFLLQFNALYKECGTLPRGYARGLCQWV